MSDLGPRLGVYVHWPYCARICPYCDFNVYKNRKIDGALWADAFSQELAHWAGIINARPLASLYFGGGTPSLAPIRVLESVITACQRHFGFEQGAEITIEVNPTDAEQARLKDFAALGVNRVSLGVQSLRDDGLKFLGRNHDAQSARRAIEECKTRFANTSIDLIYARPGQTNEEWRRELNEALSFRPEHLSLYQLTIEPGTAFARAVDANRWRPANDLICAEQYELAQDITAQAGLPAYEISNHGAPDAKSQHNLIYWMYQDYIGIGPGAHGRLWRKGERIATLTHKRPVDYLAAVKKSGAGVFEIERLSAQDQLCERMTMGLRLHGGIRLSHDDYFFTDAMRRARLDELVGENFLEYNGAILRATKKGRIVLNTVVNRLLI